MSVLWRRQRRLISLQPCLGRSGVGHSGARQGEPRSARAFQWGWSHVTTCGHSRQTLMHVQELVHRLTHCNLLAKLFCVCDMVMLVDRGCLRTSQAVLGHLRRVSNPRPSPGSSRWVSVIIFKAGGQLTGNVAGWATWLSVSWRIFYWAYILQYN